MTLTGVINQVKAKGPAQMNEVEMTFLEVLVQAAAKKDPAAIKVLQQAAATMGAKLVSSAAPASVSTDRREAIKKPIEGLPKVVDDTTPITCTPSVTCKRGNK
jgi:hypothetical protein